MKSYTDIKQSKALSEILPIESADMFHFIHEVDTVGFGYKKDAEEFYSKTEFEYIPCWSLATLLDIIPCGQVNKILDSNKYEASSWKDSGLETPVYTIEEFDNPVDACVAMIEKLNELNLL